MSRTSETGDPAPRRGRPVAAFLGVAVLCAALGGAFTWAALTVFVPPKEAEAAPEFTTVKVTEGEVSSVIALNATAQWTPQPVGTNRAAGVITSIAVQAGDELTQGSQLYTVDLRPVVVARGAVPAFRPLVQGDSGDDVAQLQQMLRDLSYFSGRADGKFGASTATAVKAWQKKAETAITGSVDVGDVVFVPQLPARMVLDPAVAAVGKQLAGGEAVLSVLPDAPKFALPVSDTQASLIPEGTRVTMNTPAGNTWDGFAGAQDVDADGIITISLTGRDGGSICGETCTDVPVSGKALLPSRAFTVEPTSGLTVPTGALTSGADGAAYVITADGTHLAVTMRASARGMSVIEGADQGTAVRVPAIDD